MPISTDPTVIAALGVYRYLEGAAYPDSVADPHWVHRIRRAVSRGIVSVSVDQALLSDTQLSDTLADALRIAWEQGAAEFHNSPWNPKLRVFVETSDLELENTVTTLIRGANGVDSVALTDRTLEGSIFWDWPLKVSTVGDDVTNAVKSYGHQQLIAVDLNSSRGERYDLLIVESTDDVGLTKAHRAGVGFLLLFVNSSDTLEAGTLRRLNQTIRFRAGAIVRRPDNIEAFVHAFLDELAHDYPPDVATTNAVVNVTGDANDALVIGDPTFLNQARVSVVSAAFEGVIEQLYAAGEIVLDDFTTVMQMMEVMPEVAAPAWLAERGAATDSVDKLTTVRTVIPALTRGSAPSTAAGRHLQAQVFEQSNAGLVQRTRSFEVDARHEVRVRIGSTGMDWISMRHHFPDKELPSNESHLTVRMLVPSPMQEPDAQEIKMAITGASTVARFEIDVPMDMEHLEATIKVLYQGKHVQTGMLSGPVTHGQLAADATGIIFTQGTASEADLEHQQVFDLNIWKDVERGELTLDLYNLSAHGDEPTHKQLKPSLAGINEMLDSIRDDLFFAAQKLDRPGTSLESAGLPMLRSLAEQGEYLRGKLLKDRDAAHVRRVQVVSPHSRDFFPVEFFYDYVLPNEDAELCPEFKSVDGPDCTDACRARAGDAKFVCPSGFWALNRIIERQVRPRDHANCHQPESTAQQPKLMPLSGIVFAASNEVNEGDINRVKDTVAEMARLAPVNQATTWSAWEKLVRNHYPSLLVALPHHIEATPFHKLQIAGTEELALNRIKRSHIAPTGAHVGSVILLLGCNTANAPVQYQDFVNEFRCAGAVLVVGTLTYVLGPQAADMAREFVTQICASSASSESKTIGEIMREVRGRMLVRDNPMALAITAFGDADWRFRV